MPSTVAAAEAAESADVVAFLHAAASAGIVPMDGTALGEQQQQQKEAARPSSPQPQQVGEEQITPTPLPHIYREASPLRVSDKKSGMSSTSGNGHIHRAGPSAKRTQSGGSATASGGKLSSPERRAPRTLSANATGGRRKLGSGSGGNNTLADSAMAEAAVIASLPARLTTATSGDGGVPRSLGGAVAVVAFGSKATLQPMPTGAFPYNT